jgi:hypothetical protein
VRPEDSWENRVRSAVIARDRPALRALFDEATDLFGDDASTRWAKAVSALDAGAQTG